MTTIFELVKDPYERKARVTPGLLVALPLLVPLLCVYGAKHPVLTGVVGLLGGCGAIYALASVARGRGKKLEEMLVAKWGGMPTTIALRHRDRFLDSVSKQRYHTAITEKLGIAMPTAEEESANPDKADDIYIGATRRLRELTRSNKKLLLKENIAYGFHRNMLAMKPVGIVSCLLLWRYLLAGYCISIRAQLGEWGSFMQNACLSACRFCLLQHHWNGSQHQLETEVRVNLQTSHLARLEL